MQRQQTMLAKDEEDFRQFESKIDEVLYLLKGMNNCDRKFSVIPAAANETDKV